MSEIGAARPGKRAAPILLRFQISRSSTVRDRRTLKAACAQTARLLSPVPFGIVITLLRLGHLVPFAKAHAVMDGASMPAGVLIPC